MRFVVLEGLLSNPAVITPLESSVTVPSWKEEAPNLSDVSFGKSTDKCLH